MTVAEILEQAKSLSSEEKKELVKGLIDLIDVSPPLSATVEQPDEHWGKSLNRLLDELGPIEMLYPEIEDPVEWVKHLREEERRQRYANWDEQT